MMNSPAKFALSLGAAFALGVAVTLGLEALPIGGGTQTDPVFTTASMNVPPVLTFTDIIGQPIDAVVGIVPSQEFGSKPGFNAEWQIPEDYRDTMVSMICAFHATKTDAEIAQQLANVAMYSPSTPAQGRLVGEGGSYPEQGFAFTASALAKFVPLAETTCPTR